MVLLIIWGSKGREKTVESGHFYCPNCRCDSPFAKKRVSRYFTLYFIPLFPLEKLGEYVECGNCQGQYDVQVAAMSRGEVEALLKPWTCSGCGNNNPSEYGECLQCGRPARAA